MVYHQSVSPHMSVFRVPARFCSKKAFMLAAYWSSSSLQFPGIRNIVRIMLLYGILQVVLQSMFSTSALLQQQMTRTQQGSGLILWPTLPLLLGERVHVES